MRNQTFLSRQLEYFSVLYRLKNYSAAAKAIPITYQGLKKSMGKLEAELDTVLFVPGDGDTIETTHSADALYDLATKWMSDVGDLEREISTPAGNGIRTLNVCSALGIMSELGLSLLFEFERQHPDVRVSFTEYSDVLTDESLLSGSYGIGFTSSPFDDNLITTPLVTLGYAAWVNKDHPLAVKSSITFEDLEGEILMIPNAQYKENAYTLQALNTRGVRLKSKRYSNDPSWSLTFAELGYGIGLTPQGNDCRCDQAGRTRESDRAVLVPLTGGYTRTIGLSRRHGHLLTRDEKAFWSYFKETCEQMSRAESGVGETAGR